MEQLDIYNYLNLNEDPLFLMINSLNKGDSIIIGQHTISLNKLGLYEIEGEQLHNSNATATGIYNLYKKIISNVS
jgi:hypothetical protein